jgi:hypothetical protein
MHSFSFIHLVVVHHVVDWSLHQQVPLVWQVMRTCNNILHAQKKGYQIQRQSWRLPT